MTTPVVAGFEVVETMPPMAAIQSVIRMVTTIRTMGVRWRRAAWRSSRIQSGLGSVRQRSTRYLARSTRRLEAGPLGDMAPVWTLIAFLPG
jgi:hypothetical protein